MPESKINRRTSEEFQKKVDDYLAGLSLPNSVKAAVSAGVEMFTPTDAEANAPAGAAMLAKPLTKGYKAAERLLDYKKMKAPKPKENLLDYGKMEAERQAKRKAAEEAAPTLNYGDMK